VFPECNGQYPDPEGACNFWYSGINTKMLQLKVFMIMCCTLVKEQQNVTTLEYHSSFRAMAKYLQ
jgi:hypothetical protein